MDEGLANAARPLRGAYIPARRLAIEEQQRGDDKPDRAAEEEDDPPGGKARQDRDAVERTCRRSAEDERGDEQADTRRDRLPQQIGADQIGRAHVCTPVTNAHLVCRLLLEKKNIQSFYNT